MTSFYPGTISTRLNEEPVPPAPPTPPLQDPCCSTATQPHPPITLSYLATKPCPADPSTTHTLRTQYTWTSLIVAFGVLPGLYVPKKRVICTKCLEEFDNL